MPLCCSLPCSAQFIRIGRLAVIDADGRRRVFPGGPGPEASIRLHDPALHWKLLANPRLREPEAYMDGTLTIEEGSLYDFLDVLCVNEAELDDSLAMRVAMAGKRLVRRLHQHNPVARRGITWRIITTCRSSSTKCSSIATGNIPALFPLAE